MEDPSGIARGLRDLGDRVAGIEARLGLVEEALRLRASGPAVGAAVDAVAAGRDEDLELRIGEVWVGQAGVGALLVALAFFITYPFDDGVPPALQITVGYLSAGAIFALSARLEHSYGGISRILLGGSLVLLFFTSVELHFRDARAVAPKGVALAVAASALALWLGVALRKGRQGLCVLALVAGFLTAALSRTPGFDPALAVGLCAFAAWAAIRRAWIVPLYTATVLSVLVHLAWTLGPRIADFGDPPGALGAVSMLLCAGALALPGILRGGVTNAPAEEASHAFLNAGGCLATTVTIGTLGPPGGLPLVGALTSAALMGTAAAHRLGRGSLYATPLYAAFGFLALTLAIVAQFPSPGRFVWLGWQSQLVILAAIWFRSRFLVVTNALIYLGILVVYLFGEAPAVWVNLNYAGVGMLSARVLNWRKDRLGLKTEFMRNVYLGSAFVIIPYGLHAGVPRGAVSLSWLGVSAFYFAISLLLRNRKYRWMAILQIFLTVVYVLAVDLAHLGAAPRIVTFFVLGLALMLVSWLYARYRKRGAGAG